MDVQTKAFVLRDMVRRMVAGGGDITSADWLQFVPIEGTPRYFADNRRAYSWNISCPKTF